MDGPTATSHLNKPTDVFVTDDDTFYFSDTYGYRIRKNSPRCIASTIAAVGSTWLGNAIVDDARFDFPRDFVVRKNLSFFAQFNNHVIRKFNLES